MGAKKRSAAGPRQRIGRGHHYYTDVAQWLVRRGPMKGFYKMPYRPRPTDYRAGEWPIWSIGKALRDMPGVKAGEFFASVDGRFYSEGKSKDWKCVWLR